MRLFFGIALPDGIRVSLRRLKTVVEGVRWIKPGNLHCTLVFLGQVEPGLLENVYRAAQKVRCDSFDIRLRHVGAFPTHHRPRVIWTGLAPTEDLVDFRSKLTAGLASIVPVDEITTFHPHVSLARIARTYRSGLEDWFEVFKAFETAYFPVTSFQLYESETRPEGAVYRVVESFPLGIPGAA